jgi:GNAT superfamily N-acetyltransferase
MKIEIRKPDCNDVSAIAALHIVAWQQAYIGMVPDHVLKDLSLERFTSRWLERIENPKSSEHVRVAVSKGEVMGFAMFGESREAMNLPQSFGEIYALYVNPNHWRKGVGKALIQYVISWFDANRYPGVFLWTLKANDQARRFYENAGMILVPQERYINTHGIELLCCCYCNKSIL